MHPLTCNMNIAVLGVGNELAADDGVGVHIVRSLRSLIPDTHVSCLESQRGGMDILEQLEGFEQAFVIDAACSRLNPPGTISRFAIRAPFAQTSSTSLHTISLDAVLSLGALAGMHVPDQVILYTIEVADIETFGAGCTERVRAAMPEVLKRLKREILSILPDARCSPQMEDLTLLPLGGEGDDTGDSKERSRRNLWGH